MTSSHPEPPESDLLGAIQNLTRGFMLADTSSGFCDRVLSAILKLTNSNSGFMSTLMLDSDGSPFSRIHSISAATPLVCDNDSLHLFNAKGYLDLTQMDLFSARVLLKGEPVFLNEISRDLHFGGIFNSQNGPHSCLGIPLTAAGRVLGMIAVVNRPDGYQPRILECLEPLTLVIGSLLAAQKIQQERLLLEQQLAKAREASAKAHDCRIFFLATISHEIRTPMNAIVGMCDLLKESELSTEQTYFTEVISRNSDSLLSMVDEVLDVAELEAGKMAVHEKQFSLEEILLDVFQAVEHKLVQKSLELIMIYPPGLPRQIFADAGKTRQILINLLDNAIKLTDSGQVRLEVEFAEPEKLLIKVLDGDDFISGLQLPQLPDLFQQGEPGLFRKLGSAGLGLGISQRLAVLLGGRLGAISERELGTAFLFEMPVRLPLSSPHTAGYLQAEPLEVHVLAKAAAFGSLFASHFLHQTACKVFCHQSWVQFAGSDLLIRAEARSILLVEAGFADLPTSLKIPPHHHNDLLVFSLPANSTTLVEKMSADQFAFLGVLPKLIGFNRFDFELAQLLHFAGTMPFHSLVNFPPDDGVASANVRPNILLVEDNPINQDVASLLLTQMGCLVDVAFNGVQALEKYLRSTYDLIFMDCQMPVMDGLTATCRIRDLEAQRRTARTPIVAITANALGSDRQTCLNVGMDDYLSKPFKRAQVRGVLDKFVHTQLEEKTRVANLKEIPAEALGHPIFDRRVMMDVADSDVDLVLRITKRYKAILPGQIKILFDVLEHNDTRRLCAEMHKIRGGAAGAGFSRFASFLDQMEQLLHDERLVDIGELRTGIEQHVKQIMEFSLDIA